jgi:hypothetical protein
MEARGVREQLRTRVFAVFIMEIEWFAPADDFKKAAHESKSFRFNAFFMTAALARILMHFTYAGAKSRCMESYGVGPMQARRRPFNRPFGQTGTVRLRNKHTKRLLDVLDV